MITITPDYKKGPIYEILAKKKNADSQGRRTSKGSIYMTAILLATDPSDQGPMKEYILLGGYTNQVPSFGNRALCLIRYNDRFELDWAYAYNTSILEYTEVFLKAYRQGIYVAGSTQIGVFELLFNLSTGYLKGHVRHPIQFSLINYTDNDTFYQRSPPEIPFKEIGVVFKNYTVTLREKGDFGVIPSRARRAVKSAQKQGWFQSSRNSWLMAVATMGAIFVLGGCYVVFRFRNKRKRASRRRLASVSSHLKETELSVSDTDFNYETD